MASNRNALGPSARALAAYREMAGDLHRYPDGAAACCARRSGGPSISSRAHRLRGRIGRGAQLLVRAYAGPGDEVLYSRHGFMIYPIAAKSVGATPVAAPERNLRTDIEAMLAAVSERTRVCLVANPNNPTGSHLSGAELERLCDGLPDQVLLVIDAAYAEYVDRPDYSSGVELARTRPNVVMTRTFSKIFGLAALRLGWAYCPPDIAGVLNRIRGPFNVPAPAQEAGIAALSDAAHVRAAKAHNNRWLPWLSSGAAFLGLEPFPSVGNFLLIRFPADPALNADAAAKFLNDRRILPRRMGGYGAGRLPAHHHRRGSAMLACAAALEDFVKSRHAMTAIFEHVALSESGSSARRSPGPFALAALPGA
jgi:histidinol-phosphate aminotransferase